MSGFSDRFGQRKDKRINAVLGDDILVYPTGYTGSCMPVQIKAMMEWLPVEDELGNIVDESRPILQNVLPEDMHLFQHNTRDVKVKYRDILYSVHPSYRNMDRVSYVPLREERII